MSYSLTQIDETLVKIVFNGDLTKYSIVALCKELDPMLDRLEHQTQAESERNLKINIISEVSNLGKVSAEARHLLAAHNKKRRIGKTAIVGFNQSQKILAHFILVESKRNNIYFFDTAVEAENWLMEKYSS